jgi:hypothetical protein
MTVTNNIYQKQIKYHVFGNAGPHVRQTFLNDVFTFLMEVGNVGCVVNTETSSVNSEFVTACPMNFKCIYF